MNLPQLIDLIAEVDWFSKAGKHAGSDDHMAITSLLASEVPYFWHWLPTGRDEADPLHSPSLKEIAEQQGKLAEAMEAAKLVYKATLVSLRRVNEDDARFTFGPHNFAHAAKGGALYAARQAAIEIVVGDADFWCSLMKLYADGYWPCGYTKSQKVIVY